MESILIFIVGAVIVVVLAAIGHFVWLILAAIAKFVFGDLNSQPIKTNSTPRPPSNSPSSNPQQRIRDDIAAASRLVEYASFNNWIDAEQFKSLKSLLASLLVKQQTDPSSKVKPAPKTAPLPSLRLDDFTGKPTGSAEELPMATIVSPQTIQETRPALPNAHTLAKDLSATVPSSLPSVLIQSGYPSQSAQDSTQLSKPVPPSSPIHPLDVIDDRDPAERKPKQQPAKQFGADLLRAFMEKSNIRWIEILSALLIVVCSVGLVISLWNTLSATSRFFPSLVFLLATVAVHAAGQYTLLKWKLPSTSRGILQIGLMLIPLAVLVGILLSRRPDQVPQLDVGTIGVLALGAVVYGALAVTASRALFGGRWLLVASAVIVGSVSLVPIHFLSSRGELTRNLSAIWLAPLVLVSLLNVLQLSSVASIPMLSPGRMRRTASQVVQVIFAALIPCAFWVMQSNGIGLSKASVAAAGLLFAGWSSWGWTASLKRLVSNRSSIQGVSTRAASQNSGLSWYIVVAWTLASVCSIALTAIVWQAMDNRAMLVISLLSLAAWWFAHGMRCSLAASMLAGSIATIVATSIFGEGLLPSSLPRLAMHDWLSLPRVGIQSIVSIVVALVGFALLPRSQDLKSVLLESNDFKDTLAKLALAAIAGASIILLGSAGLTTIASLTKISQPAYGGNWAPLMLVGYGSLLVATGIFQPPVLDRIASANSTVKRFTQTLVPFGQLVLLLAVFRLCESAPWAPEWLVKLRPTHAWAIGTGGLALIWSTMAAALNWRIRNKERILSVASELDKQDVTSNLARRTLAAHCLAFAAVSLAVVSTLVFLSRNDQFILLSSAGWILPVVLSLTFIAFPRFPVLRESAALAYGGWVLSLLIAVGWHIGWWQDLGLAATTSVLALSQLVLMIGYTHLMRVRSTEATETPETVENIATTVPWWRAGYPWSIDVILNIAWVATLVTAIIPIVLQLYFNLNGGELVERFFVSSPLTAFRSTFVGAALLGLGVFTYFTKPARSTFQLGYLATLPLAFGAIAGCQVSSPYGIPVLLWVLALTTIVVELLPLTKTLWGQQIDELNKLVAAHKPTHVSPVFWIHATRLLSLVALSIISVGLIAKLKFMGLPEALSPVVANMDSWSGWVNNLSRLSLWIGPLGLVLAVRWLNCVYSAAPSKRIVEQGYLLGMLVAVATTIAATEDLKATALFGAQSFSLTMVLISAPCLAYTTLRNWLGLRRLDPKSSAREILSKACRGSRWRTAHQASWQLWLGSIVPAFAICVLAGGLVAIYPHQAFSELHFAGGFWAIVTVAFSLAMWWILGTDESLPKLGLLAITLGLLSPVVSAGYASWLMNHPASAIVSAANFEPYRLQIGIWIAALLVGLGIRIHSATRLKTMPSAVEACWIFLAVLVGGLSLAGYADSYWSSGQLALLAAIIVVSCEASGQTWRGYAAAAVSMCVWLPWCVAGLRSDGLFFAWQTLIAVVIVAGLSVAVRRLLRLIKVEATQQFAWPIDRTTVLAVPVVSILLSGLWALMQPTTILTGTQWSILLMAVLTFALALARLFQLEPSSRGLGVYLSTIGLTLVVVEYTCSANDITRVYNFLGWWSGLLGVMAVMAFAVREITLQRTPIQQFLQSRNLADSSRLARTTNWMAIVHTLAALFCLVPSAYMVLTMSQESLRMAAIALPLIGAAAVIPVSFDRERSLQRGNVLLLISATLILAWWADLPSAWSLREPNESWLFAQRAFLALAFLGVLYPVVVYFRNMGELWSRTLSKGGWVCIVLAVVVGSGMVLGSATGHWGNYPSTVSMVAKIMTCLGWVAIFARLIQFAAWPRGWDKGASITWRSTAVYAAEIVLALVCVTIHFEFPDLFNKGRFLNWWPVILFAIAFASTLLGEWLKRIELPVLADPVRRSSLLLPVIPLLGVWLFQPERMTMSWNDFERFAVLLVIGSGLYGLHGWVRGSIKLRGLSAVLALFGFWSFLHSNPEMRFFEHPQFWLLPPAIASLAFVEFNRKRLEPTVVTAVRYLGILVAYFSSTSEVFFRSFAGNLWPPIVLLFLALCGVIAGMVLRIRAFLFCGLVFVAVALIGMVWHATEAIDQKWPWFAFGITAGIGLIILRGYFEKNRAKILEYLGDLKQWDN